MAHSTRVSISLRRHRIRRWPQIDLRSSGRIRTAVKWPLGPPDVRRMGGPHMDKENFYRMLIQALLRLGFHLRARDLSKEDLSTDRDKLSSTVRMVAQLLPPVIGALHPFFDQETVQQHLNKVREWATVVCFKYILAQPVIVAVVDADQLADEEMVNLANRFDEIVLEMRDVTGKLGGTKIGDVQLSAGTRLSVTGIILFVFFDHTVASTFIERTQKRCKIWHFWKKAWVLPWVVDVSNKIVSSHPGLPFLPGVLSRDYLQKEIFQ